MLLGAARFGEDNLGTAKYRDRFAAGFALHFRVPDLRGAPTVQQPRFTGNSAIKRSADEVGFQLRRGETRGAFGKRHYATVAARGIRECYDRRGMKIPVRSQMLLSNLEPAARKAASHVNPFKFQMSGEIPCLIG